MIPLAALGAGTIVAVPLLRTSVPHVFTSFVFLLAFLASAWWGGYGPGLLSALLTLFAIPYLVDPHFSVTKVNPAQAFAMIATSLLISYIAAARRKIEEKLRRANETLDERVRERTSELRAANDALQQSEERLRLAIVAGRMGSWDWDIRSDRFVGSPELDQLHGYPKAGFAGTLDEFLTRIHTDQREGIGQQLRRAVSERTEFHTEYTTVLPDGRIAWIEARGRVTSDDDGQPIRMAGVSMDITARKTAELAIQANERQLRLVIDTMPGLVCYIDRDLRYRFTNSRYTEWYQHPADYWRDKHVADALGPERYEKARPHLERVMKGEVVVSELAYTFVDGPERQIRATLIPDRKADGSIAGCVALIEDITEQKTIQTAIRESEERYRALVEASAQFVWISDGTGDISREHAEWWTMLTGQPPQEAHGWGWTVMLHPDDRERVRREWTTVSGARTMLNTEYRIRMRDGEYRDFAVRGVPVWNADGSFREWVGTLTDITDSKRAREALRHSEEDFRRIVETASEGIWTIDGDGNTAFANNRMAEFLRLRVDEIAGRPALDFVVDQDRESAQAALEGRTSGPLHELRLKRSDGSMLWVNFSASALRNESGMSFGVLAMLTDIGARKEAEQARIALERQLTLLIEASGTLLATPGSAEVLRTILELARQFVEADAYSVWRRDETGIEWHRVAAEGLSDTYDSVVTETESTRMPETAVAIEDVNATELVRNRASIYEREGIRSMLTVPLILRGEIGGTLVFYYRTPHHFSESEVRIAAALANLAAAALTAAELYDRQTMLRRAAEEEEQRASFLAAAGEVLASSLDPRETLAAVVDLAVPVFADWAVVDVAEPSGELRRVSVKHTDDAKAAVAFEYSWRYPPSEADPERIALRTGRPQLITDIVEATVLARGKDADHLNFIRELGLKSAIVAPMVANGQTIGILGFALAESGRRYTEKDVAFAQELARRAATAVANARLFTETRAAQEALRRVNVELRRANEDLSQFAYSASHDLQEPLRAIAIYTQLLQRRYEPQLDAQAQEYMGYTVQGARRLQELLRDLLTYTQTIDAPLNTASAVDANSIVAKTISNLSAAISETGAKVSYDRLPRVRMQEVHLVQLFQNLIGNAIKYRGTDAPRIHIGAERTGMEWTVTIRDNGIGIAPQYRDQVFKIFKRLHSTDKYAGTGIGLAICHRIVERYGGRIWVESQEGSGSTFCFTLPAVEAMDASA